MESTSLDPDQRAFLNSLRRVLDVVGRTASGESGLTPLGERVQAFIGHPVEDLPMMTENIASHRIVDADIALTELAADGELIGVAATTMREHESFAAMLRHDNVAFQTGSVSYSLVASGPDTKRQVVSFGIRLFAFEGSPVAVLQRSANLQYGRQTAMLEIVSRDDSVAGRLIAEVRRLMLERSVLRGQVLSFSSSEFDDGTAGATFVRRDPIDADAVVLADGVLASVRRHVIGIGERREALLAAGQHLKRGVLLYGPPGTGKTLTVRHIVGAAEGTTVVLLAGRTIQFISEAADLARALQPALVVLEDIDLIAMDRGRMGPQPLLFAVLDALDGLGGDADVAFLMTTNRVDQLERALAQRPGRVDLAVEIPLPAVPERERLFALYSAGLPLSAGAVAEAAQRAEGTTASFAKELMRRTVLAAAEAERAPTDADLAEALDVLLSDAAALTRSLLGSGGGDSDDDVGGSVAVSAGHRTAMRGWTAYAPRA